MIRSPSVYDELRALLKEVLRSQNRPTAILCFNSFDAEQVYLLAKELGFTIPEDLSLIYFGGDRRDSALAQRLTCIAVIESEVGVQAFRLLDAIGVGRVAHDSNQKIEIPLKLLPGQTVGPAP